MKKRNTCGRVLAWLCALCLFTFGVCVPALAAIPQRPENRYVLDSAGVLSDSTERKIIRENEKLFQDCGAEIVIVAVDFLGGQEIKDYANALFNDWGIGSSQHNNGILLVLAIGEDNYYATSGYGLEDYFDGARFRELLDEYLEEDFAAGDYDAGVEKFFDETLDQVKDYYEDYQDGYGQPDNREDWDTYYTSSAQSGRWWGSFMHVISRVARAVIVIVILIVVIRLFSGRGRGGRGGPPYGGGGGGNFWVGMMLGNMMGHSRRRGWGAPPPPPPPGGFGGPGHRPSGRPGGGFGGFGGFTGGGHSGGFGSGRFGGGGGGGFTGGGGSHGGGAGRR